ncbi:MAG TPA: RluA family pseudouridine synthase [Gemmatimonadales bacterium]
MRLQVTSAITERIDRFLAEQLALSRTVVGRLIAGNAVTVNGEGARASRRLSRGDLIQVVIPEAPPPRTLVPSHRPLDVVFEDEHLLVVDKPAGLVVHPAPGHWDDTLLNALVGRGTRLSQAVGRPGILHRLDRDTSGLMIVTKTDAAHRALARDLASRRVLRTYAALVWGHLDGAVEVDASVARHPRDRKRMAVLATGRAARTHFSVVARFESCDLVRARLESGRTHQIRVHCEYIGHPVVGDRVYGGGGAKRISGQPRAHADALDRATARQALHAARLGFQHPASGHAMRFGSDWPVDLRPALALAGDDPTLLDRHEALAYLGFDTGES